MRLVSELTAGKNTVASEIATRLMNRAVVDDAIRAMSVKPQKTSWDGDEGLAQPRFGVYKVCDITKRFEDEGYIVILDGLLKETLERCRDRPGNTLIFFRVMRYNASTKVAPFLPANSSLTFIGSILASYDLRIDSSELQPGEVAERISSLSGR